MSQNFFLSEPSEDDSSLLILVLDTNPFSWGARSLQQQEHDNNNNSNSSSSSSSSNGSQNTTTTTTTTTTSTSMSNGVDDVSSSSSRLLPRKYIALPAFVNQLMVFINSFLLLHNANRIAIISTNPVGSQYIFPKPNRPSSGSNASDSSAPSTLPDCHFQTIKKHVLAYFTQLARDIEHKAFDHIHTNEDDGAPGSMLSSALSLALAYANRLATQTQYTTRLRPRILNIYLSPDAPSQYIPVMNSIFAAQRLHIPIDTCWLHPKESTLLQQAADVTSGIYLEPRLQTELLQYLLSVFLPDLHTRKFLLLPAHGRVDYRAACFCHQQQVDKGYVCSVCLSIFCRFSPVCSTCGTKFVLPKISV
eukprot:TRINITY_DN1950_c0_g1_i1.p1 TRINITY_DN1950_c0_g1~~TRINITY_DN1950_c0_g1_i1.p1  ORF type:complete len:362 (+),score=122.73 TRINITY_DN1950_c0_g1_i1:280-1365(+)